MSYVNKCVASIISAFFLASSVTQAFPQSQNASSPSNQYPRSLIPSHVIGLPPFKPPTAAISRPAPVRHSEVPAIKPADGNPLRASAGPLALNTKVTRRASGTNSKTLQEKMQHADVSYSRNNAERRSHVVAASTRPRNYVVAGKPHQVVIQISQNDPAVMNMVLNNTENLRRHYHGKGEEVQIELVAYGPGLHMVRSDTSPVKARLKALAESTKEVTVSACENTRAAQAKQENQEITLLPEAQLVPTGIGRILELQEKGWIYVRP